MDCKTIWFLLAALLLFMAYRFANQHWPSIWTGGIWTIRGIFFLILIGMLFLGGFTGEELILGAVWAAFEAIGGMLRPKGK